MSIKPTLNIKITLNVNYYVNKTKKSSLFNIIFTLNALSENGIMFA